MLCNKQPQSSDPDFHLIKNEGIQELFHPTTDEEHTGVHTIFTLISTYEGVRVITTKADICKQLYKHVTYPLVFEIMSVAMQPKIKTGISTMISSVCNF